MATANYQASSEAYQKAGYDDEKSKELMKSAVTLASQERDRFVEEHGIKEKKPVIALSLGPYGALLQNGSECELNKQPQGERNDLLIRKSDTLDVPHFSPSSLLARQTREIIRVPSLRIHNQPLII